MIVAFVAAFGAAAACAGLGFDYTGTPDFSSIGSASLGAGNSYPTDIVPSKEGNILVATEGDDVVLIDQSLGFIANIETSGNPQLAAHPDGHLAVATDTGYFYILETTATTLSFTVTLDPAATGCTDFLGLVAQATAGGRFFVYCDSDNTHRSFNATGGDMQTSSGAPTSEGRPVLSMSPDNQFYIFAHGASPNVLYKIATDGTFDVLDTVADIGAASSGIQVTGNIYRIGIRADLSVVVPTASTGSILVFDANLTFVENVPLADIGVTCSNPFNLYLQQDGTGDIIIGCETDDGSVVIANDLSCGQDVTSTAGDLQSPIAVDRSTGVVGTGYALFMNIAATPNLDLFGVPLFVGADTPPPTESETQTHSETATQSMTPSHSQTPVPTQSAPGSVGDPILIDFSGHRFMGGARGRTEYLLYRSHDENEAITMTTGVVQGKEDGYFAVAVGVQRAGCGSLRVAAGPEHKAEISGDACMKARIARGDEGLVMVPIGEGGESGSVLAVYPHQHGDSPAFLNMRLLATTAAFRAGCTGMLCNEAHEDVVA